jgi:hypothetical protein
MRSESRIAASSSITRIRGFMTASEDVETWETRN